MEEESMEEEGGSSSSYEAMMDDQNHNNWEAAEPALPLLPEANGLLKACDAASKAGAAAAISINTSASKFLMNVITIEDYKSTYWPKLDSAIDQLLTQSPGDYIPISYEQIYRSPCCVPQISGSALCFQKLVSSLIYMVGSDH